MTAFSIPMESDIFRMAYGDRGESEEAKTIWQSLRRTGGTTDSSQTFDERPRQAVAALAQVYQECSVEDWDGYGAVPVHPFKKKDNTRIERIAMHLFRYVIIILQSLSLFGAVIKRLE